MGNDAHFRIIDTTVDFDRFPDDGRIRIVLILNRCAPIGLNSQHESCAAGADAAIAPRLR